MAKRNAIATVTLQEAAVAVKFANGFESVTTLADLSEGIRQKCAVLGLSNKLRDSYANAKTADEAQGFFEKVRETLLGDAWSSKREAAEGPSEPMEILAEAIAQVMGKAKEAVLARLQSMSPAERRGVRSNPDIGLAVAQIKAARAKDAKKVEGPKLEELFAEV